MSWRLLFASAVLLAGCPSTPVPFVDSGPDDNLDAGPGVDAGLQGNCVSTPESYRQFLNGCTTSIAVPVPATALPLAYADGGVPPPDTYPADGGPPAETCSATDGG